MCDWVTNGMRLVGPVRISVGVSVGVGVRVWVRVRFTVRVSAYCVCVSELVSVSG